MQITYLLNESITPSIIFYLFSVINEISFQFLFYEDNNFCLFIDINIL